MAAKTFTKQFGLTTAEKPKLKVKIPTIWKPFKGSFVVEMQVPPILM